MSLSWLLDATLVQLRPPGQADCRGRLMLCEASTAAESTTLIRPDLPIRARLYRLAVAESLGGRSRWPRHQSLTSTPISTPTTRARACGSVAATGAGGAESTRSGGARVPEELREGERGESDDVGHGAHPLLAVRQRLRAAAHHADVLPRRSPAGYRSIFQSVPEAGRNLLIADLDLEHGIEGVALGYRWDMVLRGPRATPMGM